MICFLTSQQILRQNQNYIYVRVPRTVVYPSFMCLRSLFPSPSPSPLCSSTQLCSYAYDKKRYHSFFFSFFRACAQHAIVILYLFCLYINFQIHWQYLIWFRLFCKAGNRHKTRADELLNISGCDSLMNTD